MGDSIVKNIDHIEEVEVKSFPGVTIGRLAVLFSNGAIDIEKYDYIIIHVGTNNIGNCLTIGNIGNPTVFDGIISDFANLIAIVRKKKPGIRVISTID